LHVVDVRVEPGHTLGVTSVGIRLSRAAAEPANLVKLARQLKPDTGARQNDRQVAMGGHRNLQAHARLTKTRPAVIHVEEQVTTRGADAAADRQNESLDAD
jgi:hypothetical protein